MKKWESVAKEKIAPLRQRMWYFADNFRANKQKHFYATTKIYFRKFKVYIAFILHLKRLWKEIYTNAKGFPL